MRTARLWLILVAVLNILSFTLGVGTVLAQETTGRIEGRVLDAGGKPIAGVDVVVSSPSLQGTQGVSTDQRGYFRILVLPVGEYVVRVTRTGYTGRVFEAVQVRLGQTTSLGEMRLEERAYEQPEVVVQEHVQLLDPASTIIGGTLSAKDYEILPVERDYRSLATILPQANQSYLGDPVNFAGATGLENRYFIDGIDVSDSYEGKAGTNLPYNFVQQVEVRTGGYEAEYRSSLGGTINAVTYSGGNEVRGQVFGFFTNNWFTGTPRSLPDAAEKGDFAIYDVGVGLGGPIQKDRFWYYLAYNPNRRQEDVEIPGWGFFEDHSTTHSFAGKLTWRAGENSTVVLTAIGDPTEGRYIGDYGVGVPLIPPANVDPFLYTVRTGGFNFMLDGRKLVRKNFLLESSLSHTIRREYASPETERGRSELFYADSTGIISGGAFTDEDDHSYVTLASLKSTWSAGNHELKAGLEYKHIDLDFDILWHYMDVSATETDTVYTLSEHHFKGKVGNRIPSVFLQESWRVNESLRLNVGVRWDGQYLMSSEGKVAQTILDQWQPRVGFAYQPAGGTQKFFGSYGRYYQELATAGVFWYYNTGTTFYRIAFDHDPRIDPSGADTVDASTSSSVQKETSLKGQGFDEYTLGYERQVGGRAKVGLRGIYRTLLWGIEDGFDDVLGGGGFGNPGRGIMSMFPRMKRDYTALEVTYQQEVLDRLSMLASYVLSRTYGNYEGLYDSQWNNPFVNATGLFDAPQSVTNATGLLPQDRTHVFKLSGSYRVGPGLTLGAVGIWESGTPYSEWGVDPISGWRLIYLSKRGTAGRTPSIWDLNLRVGYQPRLAVFGGVQPRITIDFLHVASQRRPVAFEELHYFDVSESGEQIHPNPLYGQPIGWQPPMAVRVGVEVQF